MIKAIEWFGDRIRILDQTKLPQKEVYLELSDHRGVTSAIVELKIRGAPAIGIAGAYGVALAALELDTKKKADFLRGIRDVISTIAATRPTARNLFRAIDRMWKIAEAGDTVQQIRGALVDEALRIHAEEAEATVRLSRLGADLIHDGSSIMTHCNTGSLATGGYGTALGVIIDAVERQGKKIQVVATETRPLLQGARLTTWELKKAGIPVTLITDSMVGYFMTCRDIGCIIVGADRIVANGDTANKIGTYNLAVLAMENGIPFYIAAPTSTIDLSLASGSEIQIEHRSPEEVTHIQGVNIAPTGIGVANPSFDITPHGYITAIITERGIIKEPYMEQLKRVCSE